MKPVAQRFLAIAGYSMWFCVVFALLSWLTFPWNRVRDHAIVAASDAGLSLQLDSLRASSSSIKVRGMAISSSEEDASPWLSLDTLKVGSSSSGVIAAALELRSMMMGGKPPSNSAEATHLILSALNKVQIDAELYGGEFNLVSESDGSVSRINSVFDKVNLDEYRIAMRTLTANPKGKLKGGSDLTWHWEDAKKSSGSIDLIANGLILEGLTVAGFGLPETAFDRSEAHIKVSRGRAEFRDTAFDSDVVQVVVEGYINLNTELPRSRLALRMRFKVRDDLDGLLKVQFGSNPRHKDTRGWYHYQVNGTLKRPRLRESPAAARRGRKENVSKPQAIAKPTPDASPESESGGSEDLQETRRQELDEERERLREERTRRREDRKRKREELISKRNERQSEIDSEEETRGSPEDIVLDSDEIQRSNFQDVEPANEIEDEPAAEEQQPDLEGESETDGEE